MATQKDPASTSVHEVRLQVTSLGKTLKEGKVRKFTVTCDEPPAAGGADSAPAPLEYLLLSLGF